MSSVVVTGASSGIGEATTRLLVQKGFVVFAGYRKDADRERLTAIGELVRPIRLDVTKRDEIDDAAATVRASGIPLSGLVNNAGIAIAGPLEFLPLDKLRHQFEVNVFGAIATSQAFLPQLRDAHGRIVFVGSVAGRIAVPFLGPYAGSKFALRALTDAMRMELVPAGVFVALVEPGDVKTPIWQKGRSKRAEFARILGPQAIEAYRKGLERLQRRIDEAERRAMPVERVTAAILDALTSKRPKTNYLVGSKAANVVITLPARVRDRLAFKVKHLH